MTLYPGQSARRCLHQAADKSEIFDNVAPCRVVAWSCRPWTSHVRPPIRIYSKARTHSLFRFHICACFIPKRTESQNNVNLTLYWLNYDKKMSCFGQYDVKLTSNNKNDIILTFSCSPWVHSHEFSTRENIQIVRMN